MSEALEGGSKAHLEMVRRVGDLGEDKQARRRARAGGGGKNMCD